MTMPCSQTAENYLGSEFERPAKSQRPPYLGVELRGERMQCVGEHRPGCDSRPGPVPGLMQEEIAAARTILQRADSELCHIEIAGEARLEGVGAVAQRDEVGAVPFVEI